jgi:protein-S-isoprenylcysteine O-methyltransferase
LSILWGAHAILFVVLCLEQFGVLSFPKEYLGNDRLQLLWQWSFYVICMCTFHLLEFFLTAFYNPFVATADSFLVNHSQTYTLAALLSWTEFFTRLVCFPKLNSVGVCLFGVFIAVISQTIRSSAMVTCGLSFNHLIQREKKDNHVLITHGVYKYLRHPSYFGFYYWCVGMQLVLNNYLSASLFAIASCMFFRRRIPYEEESLLHHFPNEYADYAKRTWVGIPFVPSIALELDDVRLKSS